MNNLKSLNRYSVLFAFSSLRNQPRHLNKSIVFRYFSCSDHNHDQKPKSVGGCGGGSASQKLHKFHAANVVIDSSKNTKSDYPDDSLEKEKALYQIKQTMSELFNRGEYESALSAAKGLQRESERFYGKKTAIYASCVNNVALMNKMLGNYEIAMKDYQEALALYEEVSGKKSISYATTLNNIGVLYKLLASQASSLDEKNKYFFQAQTILLEASELHSLLHGPDHRQTLNANVMLASVYHSYNKIDEAFQILNQSLLLALKNYGEEDTIVAVIYNNLGYYHKLKHQHTQAHEYYTKALKIRRLILGEKHPETIVALNNIAENYLASGHEDKAKEIQQQILKINGIDPENDDEIENNTNTRGNVTKESRVNQILKKDTNGSNSTSTSSTTYTYATRKKKN